MNRKLTYLTEKWSEVTSQFASFHELQSALSNGRYAIDSAYMKKAPEDNTSNLPINDDNAEKASYSAVGRSLFWRVFLLKRNLDLNQLVQQVEIGRIQYSTLRTKFKCDQVLKTLDIQAQSTDIADNVSSPPLNRTTDDITYASDSEELGELKQLAYQISQDVNRSFPDMPFFRDHKVQNYLFNMLYVYANLNPDLGYRQGMHELAGPILYVIMKDTITPSATEPQVDPEDSTISNNISLLLDFSHVEHDAYLLFNAVMQVAHEWYAFPTSSSSSSAPIIDKAQYIQSHILRIADTKLERTLSLAEIEPQLWAIRWIRLLFGREFPFQFTLSLWDSLFAVDGDTLELVDYICVVLLLRIRWKIVASSDQVLSNEGPTPDDIMMTLFKYPLYDDNGNHGGDQVLPTVTEPWRIVSHAIFLKSHLTPDAGKFIRDQYSHIWRKPIIKNGSDTIVNRLSSSQFPSVLSSAATSSKNLRYLATKVSKSKEWYALDKFVRERVEEVRSKAADYDIQDVINNPSTVAEFIKDRLNSEPALISKQQVPVGKDNPIELEVLSMVEKYQASFQEEMNSRNESLSKLLTDALQLLHQIQSTGNKEEVVLEFDSYKRALADILHVKECLDDSTLVPDLNLVEGNDPLGISSLSVSSKPTLSLSSSKRSLNKKPVLINSACSQKPLLNPTTVSPARISLAQGEFSWMLNSPGEITPENHLPQDAFSSTTKQSLMNIRSRSLTSSPVRNQTSTGVDRLSGLFNRRTNRKATALQPSRVSSNDPRPSVSDPALAPHGDDIMELL